ncbi:uncharacterized protein LOC108666817 [Hyalella azteca]|uniref:Uncharacterized protein LOC108666817 n=1 Tax=Hyalella azteca TaxID=294128 RepID=A0A8B7N7H8_HYAAZ|nr:uncharacterized protein LOC108666817 [Hyalella azteca]
MNVVTLDISGITSACKDFLTAEWSSYKKSSECKVGVVCIYSVGGPRGNPASVLDSVACGLQECELLLKDVVDAKVASDCPVLESEVVVGADCSFFIYPERHRPDETPYTKAYTVGPPPPPPAGKRKKVVIKSAEEQYLLMMEQVGNYMLDHIKKMSQPAVPSGNMKVQYLLIASATLIKNRLNYYKDILRLPSSKTFSETVNRASELTEVLSQSVFYYQCELLRSSLMHDTDSHDWLSDKQFQEGEQISTAVRMWIFHVQGIRNDLYRYCSPAAAHSLLSSIVSDTLNILITRYMQATPSDRRVLQYRGDVLAILGFVAALLPSLVRRPAELFTGELHRSAVLPLHRRALLLLSIAAVKAAPLPVLVKHRKLLQTSTLQTDSESSSAINICSTPAWLTFVNKELYPPGVTRIVQLPSNVATLHMMLAAASSPAPDWPLLVRSLVHESLFGARALLRGLRDFWSGARQEQPCGGALCAPHLCSPPLTPQTVYAAVVQIVYRCADGRYLLRQIMFPDKINPASWDSLDQAQVWNSQRPPWHHVLVQLAVPAVLPAVQQVVRTLPAEAPAQPAHPGQLSVRLEHHLTTWILQLLRGVEAAADDIPESLIEVCAAMDAAVPAAVKPVGGHVMSQVLVEALYSVINSRSSVSQLSESSKGVTEDQWNMLTAMAERLCALHSDAFIAALHAINSATAFRLGEEGGNEKDRAVPNPLSTFPDEELAEAVAESLASQVLAAVQGQHALGIVRKFLQHNMEWVQQVLDVPSLLPLDQDLSPRSPSLVFAPEPLIYNPLYYHAMLFYAKFQQGGILRHECNWDLALTVASQWLPPAAVTALVATRCELQPDAILTLDEKEAVATIAPLLDTLHEE